MPIYDFICEPCGQIKEELVRKLDEFSAPLCPKCGKSMTRKVGCEGLLIRGPFRWFNSDKDYGKAGR